MLLALFDMRGFIGVSSRSLNMYSSSSSVSSVHFGSLTGLVDVVKSLPENSRTGLVPNFFKYGACVVVVHLP
jgi:hypothetical protein